MTQRLRLELEPEVERWLAGLDDDSFHQAAQALDRLEQFGSQLKMPFSRPLGAGLFELRFHCEAAPRRVTYWHAPGGRAIALTTFRKQRGNERREIDRARRALRRCPRNTKGVETMTERRSWNEFRAERAAEDPHFEGKAARARLRFDLAQLVYDLRKQSGLTQTALAERMGTTQSAIARLEGGGTNPTVELLHRLGNALGVRLLLSVDDGNAPRSIPVSGAVTK